MGTCTTHHWKSTRDRKCPVCMREMAARVPVLETELGCLRFLMREMERRMSLDRLLAAAEVLVLDVEEWRTRIMQGDVEGVRETEIETMEDAQALQTVIESTRRALWKENA